MNYYATVSVFGQNMQHCNMFHWMCKLLFIALAFAACLLLPDGREEALVVDTVSVSVEFTAGNADSDQWHCERLYNLDLGQFGLL